MKNFIDLNFKEIIKRIKMKLKQSLNRGFFFIKQHLHLILFIITLLCISFVGLYIFNFGFFLLVREFNILYQLFRIILFISGIYFILLLPSYPIFSILLKGSTLNKLEKISLMIITNMSFYIIIGYIGNLFQFEITDVLFYSSSLVAFLLFSTSILIYLINKKQLLNHFKRYNANYREDFLQNFSILRYFRKIGVNSGLLVIFVFLLCCFNLFSSSVFSGTDPWLHISIVKMITEMNFLPLEEYLGNMGLHIIGALFYFFCGISHLSIPQLYIFFSVPLSSIVVYIIIQRIFQNKNLSIFGVFIAEIASLGYGQIMQQYWAVTLALMQSLMIFFLLYIRIGNFLEREKMNYKDILLHIGISYPLILILFLSSLFTHSLVTMIFIISYLWVFLIYFLKDFRRSFDFIFLCVLAGVFFIFFQLDFATGHFSQFKSLAQFPIYYYFLLLGGLLIIFAPIVWSFLKNIKFNQKILLKIDYKGLKNYKTRETKIIIPLSIIIVGLLSVIFFFGNIFLFKFDILTMLPVIEIFLFSFFSIWGYILFQKSTRGKLFFIWLIGLGFLILFGLLYDVFIAVEGLWLRILHMASPVLIIGFISYIYKLIKIKLVQLKKIKIYVVFIIIFSCISSLSELGQFCRNSSLNKREIRVSQWYNSFTIERNAVIAKYGMYFPFIFYGYPYYLNNEHIKLDDVIYHRIIDDNYALPENHVKFDINILQVLKDLYDTDLYILLPSEPYQTFESFSEIYGNLNRLDLLIYYNLPYLNRIFSSKSLDLREDPLYWVI
jgi:hypothetical protein